MATLFLVCAVVGGALLALQIVMSLLGASDVHLPGFEHSGDHAGDVDAGDALNLLSLRALTAGALFFGLIGLYAHQHGLGPLAVLPALPAGMAAAAGVAWAIRAMTRFESDGAEQLALAVGQTATVYLGIPGGRAGAGKVHLSLAGRLVEYRAQAEQALPTGTSVLVVDVVGPDLVEVIPSPQLGA